ncbi:selenium metabolism-associated LysR family transcriptional regulator [Romboutsia ilealis]|uniref:selenium metabolism-associated LysR family transcriptional regulator n=2 Tax=Romboutsia ilealis TaxID=1115758 RepID=UPI0025B77BC5|nr:selenium metabolism-associated LysR family transcriptional regulator [Romboutsia ilealis]
MDVKQLEAFVTVAKYKSFSKAARELFLTQPTVSSHIQNLEKELDAILFNRNNKCITLTKSGEILLENAISILNNCKKAIYDIKEHSGKIEGLIDIASSSIPETYILPNFIKSFHNQYPNVKFSISHYDSQYAISEILNGRISFGFVGYKTSNPKIKSIDLISDELILIAPIDLNIDNDNGYIDINELNKLNFIMRKEGSGTRNLTINILKEHKFNINNLDMLAYVESNETIKEMVKIGLGVSFVSYNSAKDYIKSNKIKFYRIKSIDFTRKFYFIYSKKKAFSPLENKFLNSLCEYFDIKREID